MEYMIVEAKSTDELTLRVNEAIHDGWIPQGGLTTGTFRIFFIFYQAMIREEKNKGD